VFSLGARRRRDLACKTNFLMMREQSRSGAGGQSHLPIFLNSSSYLEN
jgi:hypothetical protein